MDVSLSELWELVIDREAWRAETHGVVFCNPMDQARMSMGFPRQEYHLTFSPDNLPDPEIEPTSLTSPVLAGRFFTTSKRHY